MLSMNDRGDEVTRKRDALRLDGQFRDELLARASDDEELRKAIREMTPDQLAQTRAIIAGQKPFPSPVESHAESIATKMIKLVRQTPHRDIEGIIGCVRPLLSEYRQANHFDTNAECFASLELTVRREAVRTRIQTLLSKMPYRRLCQDKERTMIAVRKLASGDPSFAENRVLDLVDACYNDIAGVLFRLPRLISIAELKNPTRDTIHDMMWNEPVPVVIDEGNNVAVRQHLMPDLPDPRIAATTQGCYLWGRRALVSFFLLDGPDQSESFKSNGPSPEHREQRKILQERLDMMVRVLLREHRRDWESFSPYVRETTMTFVQARSDMLDETIRLSSERLPVVSEVLRAVRRQYDIVRNYYRQEQGSRRNRRIRHARKPGVVYTQDTNETVAKLMTLESRISEANKGIKERASSGRGAEEDTAGHNPMENVAAGQGQANPIEPLDVLEWLKEQLGKPDLDSDTIKKLARQFLADFRS